MEKERERLTDSTLFLNVLRRERELVNFIIQGLLLSSVKPNN